LQGPTFTAIGLPDGGVPLQAQPHPQLQQQPQMRPLQPMGLMPSQPIDLGALEGSGPAQARTAGPAPPTAVRPGQVRLNNELKL
jgi:hypothetical protein